jgi:hypothetical protein
MADGEAVTTVDEDVFVLLSADRPVAVYATRGAAEHDADILRAGHPRAADDAVDEWVEVRGYPVLVAPRFGSGAAQVDAAQRSVGQAGESAQQPSERHLTLVTDRPDLP